MVAGASYAETQAKFQLAWLAMQLSGWNIQWEKTSAARWPNFRQKAQKGLEKIMVGWKILWLNFRRILPTVAEKGPEIFL